MANVSFLPSREPALLAWSSNFETKITATPTAYGLTAPQATAYAALHTAFATAFAACNTDTTNSQSATATKNTAKKALIASARQLAGIVQRYPATTDAQRLDLGLTVHDVAPTPVPIPDAAPGVSIVATTGHTVRIRLQDIASPTSRAKPPGVQGASVFSFVGATPPANVADWKFEGNTTQRNVDVQFDSSLAPGSIIWLTAFWYNRRAQSGPGCTPVSALIAGGQMQQAA